MTTSVNLSIPSFSIVTNADNTKSLKLDVKLGVAGNQGYPLEALDFTLSISGFPAGFATPSSTIPLTGTDAWFTTVNTALLPGFLKTTPAFLFSSTGDLTLRMPWMTDTGVVPPTENTLFTLEIPLGNNNLSGSIFALKTMTFRDALFDDGSTNGLTPSQTVGSYPAPLDLVAPKLISITSKVGGVTATDGSDIDTALDVKANQDIEVTFTFSKSIQPGSFNFDDLEFNQMAQQGSLTPVDATNTVFKATFNPTDMNIWNGSVGIKAGAIITGTNNLALDMTAMPSPLLFAGDTLAPMTPSVQVEDIGVPGAGTVGNLTTDGVVNKVVLRSTGADSTNTQTINYYVDAATVPTAPVSGSTAMGTGTTLNLSDGAHTVRAQAVDAAGNLSDMSTTINFTVDTKAPWVGLVESVSSIPGLASPPGGQYFHVQFSENVIQVNPNDFRVLNADGSVNSTATITSFYRGTSGQMGDIYTPEDDYYVVVNSSGQTNLSVGVVPVVNIIATTAYSGTPAGATQLDSATQAMLTGGTWVKFDLNNPVASLPTSSGWLTTTSTQAGVTAPWVAATVQDTPQSFYAYVKSTTGTLDVSKLTFTSNAGGDTGLQSFGATITDIAGNSLKTNHNASFTSTTASTNEGNSGSQAVRVDVSLDGVASSTITVPITVSGTATAGTDYTYTPASITIPIGSSTGSASFTVVGDTTFESNETVVLTMGTPTGATLGTNTTYTHTITNDDLDPMLDDEFIINASTSPTLTPTLASNPNFIARPETGVGGFDTLDLSALSSTQPIDVLTTDGRIIVQGATSADTKVYRFEDFDQFVISNAGGVNFRGSMDASEVVQLKVASSNDIRLANKPTTDLSAETDIVDYSATNNAVDVNLGTVLQRTTDGSFYVKATKGAEGAGGVDTISGAEGIFGSTAGDTITGNSRDNLLAGGAGNDTLDGAAGNDILVGGAGTGDILIGGTGKDILIDLDGGTLTGTLAGPANKKGQGASGDKDVFVVRNGSTIENFHVAKDGAGLAGRAVASANDTILFNLSVGILSEKLVGYSAAVAGKSASELQVELAKIKGDIDIRVERTAAGSDDWAVIASYTGGLHSSTVELARVIVKDMDASAMPASSVLTDVALPDFSFENAMSDKIDQLVFSQVSDLLVDDQAINLAVALESVRQGTVREVKAGGLMFGDFSLTERIFNPGAGSEQIFGSNKKDTYEFLVQDFKSANGISSSDAGMDSIMDTGGDDTVAFSNITLSQIEDLNFTAVTLGRESGNYSLRSNYSQSAEGITNTGEFTWTGHFREGMGMELEKITLGNTTLEMADVRYRYDEEGNLLGWTPNQVASAGKDTIMVGGVGRSADASTFVVEKGTDAAFNTGIGADNKQNLFLWDADASDVIDLKAFFADATTARNAVQDSTPATPINTFTIDLNATQDLVLNFMDTNLTQESLEMMIARAYG
jgi:hypothetical protein